MEANFFSEIAPLFEQGSGFGYSQMLGTFVRDGIIGWLEIASVPWVMLAAIVVIVHLSARKRDRQSTFRRAG